MAFLPIPCPLTPKQPSTCTKCTRSSTPTMKSKRKRPKSSQQNGTSPSTPPRIDLSSSTLSLRQQLHLAKSGSAASAPMRPVVRTKFRRKKAVAPRPAQASDTPLPDGKYAKAPDPLLYVDGYNVIGTWPRLRKFRDRSDMDSARRLLIDDIGEFAYVRGWECVIVFDAQGTNDEEHGEESGVVSVVYTGTETADSYIERCVYQMCEQGDRQIWAATSDIAQLSFSSGKGAHVMSSKLFIQEIKRVKKETKERVEQRDESALKGKMLISNVDAVTRDRLYKLRDGKL